MDLWPPHDPAWTHPARERSGGRWAEVWVVLALAAILGVPAGVLPGPALEVERGRAPDVMGERRAWVLPSSEPSPSYNWTATLSHDFPGVSATASVMDAYDPSGGYALFVFWGGGATLAVTSIVKWQSDVWTALPIPSGLFGLDPEGLAFDVVDGYFVLLGGSGGAQETWTFGPSGWTQLGASAGAPSPPDVTLEAQSMVYDATAQVVLLLSWNGESWTFSAGQWSEVASSGAPFTSDLSPTDLVDDPAAGAGDVLDLTSVPWEFSAGKWRNVSSIVAPYPYSSMDYGGPNAAYDPLLQEVVADPVEGQSGGFGAYELVDGNWTPLAWSAFLQTPVQDLFYDPTDGFMAGLGPVVDRPVEQFSTVPLEQYDIWELNSADLGPLAKVRFQPGDENITGAASFNISLTISGGYGVVSHSLWVLGPSAGNVSGCEPPTENATSFACDLTSPGHYAVWVSVMDQGGRPGLLPSGLASYLFFGLLINVTAALALSFLGLPPSDWVLVSIALAVAVVAGVVVLVEGRRAKRTPERFPPSESLSSGDIRRPAR